MMSPQHLGGAAIRRRFDVGDPGQHISKPFQDTTIARTADFNKLVPTESIEGHF